jgi:NadR type nicotinamide-nucleotide adenylyltransferase
MEKKYKHALVLGKFMPLHRGHQYLIETAAEQSEQVTVLVCSLPTEPIPGALRYAWVKRIYPQLRVIHLTDLNPSYPAQHKFFDAIWTDSLRRNVPQADVVFSSEDYGANIARWLGIAEVLVDKPRQQFPVSGTAVRQNPWANWDFLPPPVRGYYCRKVALIGPESVGKTTLAEQLAAHFEAAWVAEYGRDYTDRFGTDLSPLDLSHIAAGQLLWEQLAAEKSSSGLLFCDTELVATQIWSEIYCEGFCPQWIYEQNHQDRYELYLLLDIDLPWTDDGTRIHPHWRQRHFERICEELESRNLPYVLVRGQAEARLQNAIAAVKSLVAGVV